MAVAQPSTLPTKSEMDGLLRRAILEKLPISTIYDGKFRLLCPYMLGRNKDGQLRILCLQFGGESGSGLPRRAEEGDWRCLAIEKLNDVTLVDEAWQTVSGPLRLPTCMEQIELQVGD